LGEQFGPAETPDSTGFPRALAVKKVKNPATGIMAEIASLAFQRGKQIRRSVRDSWPPAFAGVTI